MDELTRTRIRNVFLAPARSVAVTTAAALLGLTRVELQRELQDGAIVAAPFASGQRIERHELIAAAMRLWEQATIEEALGEDAVRVLPESLRLVDLRARIPRYLRDMLQHIARKLGASVDEALIRRLEDDASAYAEDLAPAIEGFAEALHWPAAPR